MNKKRMRFRIGRDDRGDTCIIEAGLSSVSDVRNMAEKFDVEVRGVTPMGRSYSVMVPRAVSKEVLDSCAGSGNGDPPKNNINIF